MKEDARSESAARPAKAKAALRRLLLGLLPPTDEERFLRGAADLAELERRLRALERDRQGPWFVTFNH